MLEHIFLLLILSVLIVFFMPYAQQGAQLLLAGHDWIAEQLGAIFAGGQGGMIAKQLIALLAIPVIAGLVPAIIYWIAKRSWLPCFMEIVWVVWLFQAGALVIMYKAVVVVV